MNIIKINGKLTKEEKETILVYDIIDKKWKMDTTIAKHMNKAKKQGWEQVTEYVDEDDNTCGGVFEAHERAITIRNPNKKRVMSELQMGNLHRHDEDDEDDED